MVGVVYVSCDWSDLIGCFAGAGTARQCASGVSPGMIMFIIIGVGNQNKMAAILDLKTIISLLS